MPLLCGMISGNRSVHSPRIHPEYFSASPVFQSAFEKHCISMEKSSRGGESRTPDLLVPNQARYQLRYAPKSIACRSGRSVLYLGHRSHYPAICSSNRWNSFKSANGITILPVPRLVA